MGLTDRLPRPGAQTARCVEPLRAIRHLRGHAPLWRLTKVLFLTTWAQDGLIDALSLYLVNRGFYDKKVPAPLLLTSALMFFFGPVVYMPFFIKLLGARGALVLSCASVSASFFASTPHVAGMCSLHRACTLHLHVVHWWPCRLRPHSSEPQWSQNVGRMYVCTLKRCGTLTLKPDATASCEPEPGQRVMTDWWHFLWTTSPHTAFSRRRKRRDMGEGSRRRGRELGRKRIGEGGEKEMRRESEEEK